MCMIQPLSADQLADLHTRFLVILPRIERHGRIYFRHVPKHKKDEVFQEMRALAWLWFRRLAQRGKDVTEFMTTFTTFLVRAINNGRRLLGYEKAKDAMNVMTQRRRGFRVEPLPHEVQASYEALYSSVHGQRQHDAFEERLCDNTMTPVPDQAAFRIDWPAWVRTRTDRDRRIIERSCQFCTHGNAA